MYLLLLIVLGLVAELDAQLPLRGAGSREVASLRSKFSSFETLRVEDIQHSAIRSNGEEDVSIQFYAYNRQFHLELSPSVKTVPHNIEAYCIGDKGSEYIFIDKSTFTVGKVQGDEHSLVAAHMTKSGVLSATISTATDTYHIEPSDRYLSYPHAFQMIVYRGSDVINPPIQFADDMIVNQRSGSAFHRNKVSAQSKDIKSGDVCKMILVGDHTFYKQMFSDCEYAANYLVEVLHQASVMTFEPVTFTVNGKSISGIGLQANKIVIRKTASSVLYNSNEPQSSEDYINSFTDQTTNDINLNGAQVNFGDYCLATAFTNKVWSDAAGVAFVGTTCQDERNTGFVSLRNWNGAFSQASVRYIFAHEIGHNWGSGHDSQPQCAGYIMGTVADTGKQEFSTCSIEKINKYFSGSDQSCFMKSGSCFESKCDYDYNRGCYCDAYCTTAKDCCPDYSISHCAGYKGCNVYGCGNVYNPYNNCQCDPFCVKQKDCCEDFDYICGAVVMSEAGQSNGRFAIRGRTALP